MSNDRLEELVLGAEYDASFVHGALDELEKATEAPSSLLERIFEVALGTGHREASLRAAALLSEAESIDPAIAAKLYDFSTQEASLLALPFVTAGYRSMFPSERWKADLATDHLLKYAVVDYRSPDYWLKRVLIEVAEKPGVDVDALVWLLACNSQLATRDLTTFKLKREWVPLNYGNVIHPEDPLNFETCADASQHFVGVYSVSVFELSSIDRDQLDDDFEIASGVVKIERAINLATRFSLIDVVGNCAYLTDATVKYGTVQEMLGRDIDQDGRPEEHKTAADL